MKRCINIDWLEVFCLESRKDGIQKDCEFFRSKGYEVKPRTYGTPIYKEMFTIYENGLPFLEIRRNPYSVKSNGGIFDEKACHIRLSNRMCYERNPIDHLRAFLVAFDYTYKSLTRIDICCDFNKFDDGGDVQGFIAEYMAGKISKVNQPRLSAHGCDTWANGRQINSLKWGSQSSPNTTKLYNKTMELSQVGDKPYIRQRWKESGLDLSKDVWRIEFSLTSQFQTLRNKKNGEILKKDITAYDKPFKLLQQFFILYSRYFDFRHVETSSTGKLKSKYKCSKRLCLQYYGSDVAFEPIRNLTKEKRPDRTFKILAARLEQLQFDITLDKSIRDAATTLLCYFEYHLNICKNIYMRDQRQQELDDWFKLRFIKAHMDEHERRQAQEMAEFARENKERATLKMLMRKYGIVAQPLDCPF